MAVPLTGLQRALGFAKAHPIGLASTGVALGILGTTAALKANDVDPRMALCVTAIAGLAGLTLLPGGANAVAGVGMLAAFGGLALNAALPSGHHDAKVGRSSLGL